VAWQSAEKLAIRNRVRFGGCGQNSGSCRFWEGHDFSVVPSSG
jgi:hypothetical protein